jgi:SAM-dependent methyltransferase
MNTAAKDKWERRYAAADYEPIRTPSAFLTLAASSLTPGRALCLAAGAGRNGVWLARAGWQVTAVDISPQGLAWCQRMANEESVSLETIEADLSHFDLGTNQWDLVTMIFYNEPALFPSIRQALRPGGHFLFHTFSVHQLKQRWGPSSPEHLARRPDLEEGFGDWDWPRYDDDDFPREDGRLESSLRLLATKPVHRSKP